MENRHKLGVLADDGTMDTVIQCEKCGEEMRYTFDPGPDSDGETFGYDAYVQACIEDFDSEHECPDEDEEDRQ